MNHVIAESEVFSEWRDDYFGSDEEYRRFTAFLDDYPTVGDVITATGGVRKVRWRLRGRGGKAGGIRVIYLHLPQYGRLFLIHVYAKNEQTDLSIADRREIRRLVEEYRASLEH